MEEKEQTKKEEIVKCPYCSKLFDIKVGLKLIKEDRNGTNRT